MAKGERERESRGREREREVYLRLKEMDNDTERAHMGGKDKWVGEGDQRKKEEVEKKGRNKQDLFSCRLRTS